MNNINHQQQYTRKTGVLPQISNNFHQQQDNRTCYCPMAMTLKLKVINVSSENQVLKKKLAQIQQELEKFKKYEQLFSQANKAQKIGLSRSKQTNHSEHLSLIVKTSGEYNTLLNTVPMKESELVVEQTRDQKEHCHKLESYEYFRKLASQDKQTVKSLQFSFDSKSWQQSRAHLHYSQQEFFSLREEYEQMLQNLEMTSQIKIKHLQEEVERLTKINEQLQQSFRLESQEVFQADQYEVRQTGYFKSIREQQIQESINESQIQTTQIINHFNFNESHSLSSQNLGAVTEQMRDLKSTLERTYDFLRSVTHQLKNIIRLCKAVAQAESRVKILPIDEYIKLLEHRKRQTVTFKKCQLLEVQNLELRQIIGEITAQLRQQ